LFAYIDSPAAENVTVSGVKYKEAKRKYIFPAGTYDEGDKVSFVFDLDDSTLSTNKHLVFYVYSMNRALFDDGMELLSDEQLEITRKDSTVIEGNIDVKKDGLLYLSIPYEKGWKLYVDGVKTEIKPLEDAMITADLTKGYHEIKLTYSPDGFVLGVVVSIVGLAAFVVLMILKKKKSRE
jgi:uncharacterized membrane protein YfhO